jgi:two-component system CheB/CheR fusion protein
MGTRSSDQKPGTGPPAALSTIDQWVLSLVKTSADYSVALVDLDGVILAWLGASERIFGFTAEEAVGSNLSMVYTPEDVQRGLDRHERALALSAGRAQNDRWHVRKDGSRFWGSGVMAPIRDDTGAVVALSKVMRDRTDTRAQVETLQNQLAAADDETARCKHFMVAAAHEIRNRVSPIMNAVALLGRPIDNAAREQALAVLKRQAGLMTTLLNDLSDAAAAGVGRIKLDPVRLDMLEAVREAASTFAHVAAERKQSLQVTVPETPIHIDADPNRLAQILSNLLTNAIKYTPEGGTIQLSATAEADMAVIRVEDDGCGISGDVLPDIFELFTREARSGFPTGLGVGLNVVKQLVTAHGGMVTARSPGPGKGSVFSVRLPLPNDELSPGPAPASDI